MPQHEVDRNQELLARIKKLEEREAEMERNLSEKVDANRAIRKNLEALNKKLEDRDERLSSANQVPSHGRVCPPPRVSPLTLPSGSCPQTVSALRDEVRELKQKIQNQDSAVSAQTLENQELQEQLDLQRRYRRSLLPLLLPPPLLSTNVSLLFNFAESIKKSPSFTRASRLPSPPAPIRS